MACMCHLWLIEMDISWRAQQGGGWGGSGGRGETLQTASRHSGRRKIEGEKKGKQTRITLFPISIKMNVSSVPERTIHLISLSPSRSLVQSLQQILQHSSCSSHHPTHTFYKSWWSRQLTTGLQIIGSCKVFPHDGGRLGLLLSEKLLEL